MDLYKYKNILKLKFLANQITPLISDFTVCNSNSQAGTPIFLICLNSTRCLANFEDCLITDMCSCSLVLIWKRTESCLHVYLFVVRAGSRCISQPCTLQKKQKFSFPTNEASLVFLPSLQKH